MTSEFIGTTEREEPEQGSGQALESSKSAEERQLDRRAETVLAAIDDFFRLPGGSVPGGRVYVEGHGLLSAHDPRAIAAEHESLRRRDAQLEEFFNSDDWGAQASEPVAEPSHDDAPGHSGGDDCSIREREAPATAIIDVSRGEDQSPVPTADFASRTTDELLGRLNEIVTKVMSKEATYASVRDEYIGLHNALSDRLAVPPAFRPPLRLSRVPEGEKKQVHRDQQVIDVYWCYCNSYEPRSELARAAAEGVFDPEQALVFAVQERKMNAKAREFRLSSRHQLECIWLCKNTLRDARNRLIDQAARERQKLIRRATDIGTPRSEKESLKRIGDLNSVAQTWLARELARLIEPSMQLSDQQLADFYAWLTGQRISRHSIRKRREQISKHIDRKRASGAASSAAPAAALGRTSKS